MEQKPSIGRIVHFTPYSASPTDPPYAAIVTRVWGDECVNLAVFDYSGQTESRTSVMFNTDGIGGTWRWPPRAH